MLDISKDPMEQSFQKGHYGLIVAANVLHAAVDLDATLSNVWILFKLNGKLVILKITDNEWVPQVIFGTLAGRWYRTLGPCISTTSWNEALIRNGFSGTDIVLHDSGSPESRICISLIGLKVPLLASISDVAFAALRAVLLTVSTLLWIRDRGDDNYSNLPPERWFAASATIRKCSVEID